MDEVLRLCILSLFMIKSCEILKGDRDIGMFRREDLLAKVGLDARVILPTHSLLDPGRVAQCTRTLSSILQKCSVLFTRSSCVWMRYPKLVLTNGQCLLKELDGFGVAPL